MSANAACLDRRAALRRRQDHLDSGADARLSPEGRQSRRTEIRAGLYRSGLSQGGARPRQLQSRLLGDGSGACSAALAGQAAQGAELVLAEGSMGLFDGVPAPAGRTGASADVAAALGLPVLLVLDASGQAQSAGAIAKGCATFDPRVTIAGVVLNKIGSPRHLLLATAGIEAAGLKVVGALAQAGRDRRCRNVISASCRPAKLLSWRRGSTPSRLSSQQHVDLDAVLALAAPLRATSGAKLPPWRRRAKKSPSRATRLFPFFIRIFSAAGGRRAPNSSFSRRSPTRRRRSDCDACWLPGGYPELHAGELAGHARFLAGLRAFRGEKARAWRMRRLHGSRRGLDRRGGKSRTKWRACLSVETSFAKRKMTLGYRDATLLADCALGARRAKIARP